MYATVTLSGKLCDHANRMLSKEQLLSLKVAGASARFCEEITGCPAEMTLAQWALESGWGNHQPGNNCFGIKYTSNSYGMQMLPTIEVVSGKPVKTQSAFATFRTLRDCFEHHANLITTALPYAAAFENYLESKDLAVYMRAIAAKYATDPQYADKLTTILQMQEVQTALKPFRLA